jgi:hypothetical protein
MSHPQYIEDWREAIYKIAESTGDRSVEMMATILRGSATKLIAEPTVSQNLVIRIVDGFCQERKNHDVLYFPSKFFLKRP